MTTADIKRLEPRVEKYICRVTLLGQPTITIWYGQTADTIFITEENEKALKHLMDTVDKRRIKNGIRE